jgi:hypothetical protein
MTTYRVSAEFYIQADSEDEAEDALYDGLSSDLKTHVEVSDIWGYDD